MDVGGAPTKYKQEYADLAYKYCLLGATDDQLAEFFGTVQKTINNWKKKHKGFLQSIRAGKEEADARVAQSLFHRATGYSHKEEKVFNHGGEILTHECIKHYPPDATSAIFWLKNRQKDNWRDKQDHEHTGKDGEALYPSSIEVKHV